MHVSQHLAIPLLCTLALGTGCRSLECPVGGSGDAVPAWRGTAPGTAYLGPDVLWRSRESLVFHMQDEAGDGFRLAVDVRDMNTYQQGERPAVVLVVGPSGRILVHEFMPDDGVVSGNELYRDGISDVYQDFRFREWHRVHSPNGYPPTKQRSPCLEHPERVFARRLDLIVPADGTGLYRVVCIGSWDHWFALTPDRPIATGIHPGAGPLYVHGLQLAEAYLYAPRDVKDIGIALSEEIQPYNWQVVVENEAGRTVARTTPKTFFNTLVIKGAAPNSFYRLRVTGKTTGACLHVCGVPAVLCPDLATARKLHGGVETDGKGRVTFHGSQRLFCQWADSLTPGDLAVAPRAVRNDLELQRAGRNQVVRLSDIPRLAAAQDTDPASRSYGQFNDTGDAEFEAKFSYWAQKTDALARAAALDNPENPYFQDPALVRRALLARATGELPRLGPYFWFQHSEGPREFKTEDRTFWDLPFRSAWFPMHDAFHIRTLELLKDVAPGVLPDDVLAAWRGMFEQWAVVRTLMHQGECSNQWAAALLHMSQAQAATQSATIERILKYQVRRIVTKGNLGRVGPEPTPYASRSRLGYTYAADCGYTGGGYLGDGLGHDNEYCLETESHLCNVYAVCPDPGIIDYLNDYYYLKTHLTLPKWGVHPTDTFGGTCSPTDSNHRTRYYTHKSPLTEAVRPRVRYGDIWAGKSNPDYTWPCLDDASFVRNLDNEYFFINTPGYYAILFAGQANYDWGSFTVTELDGDSARFVGYSGMHYGGLGRKATKIGGVSAVFVKNCGPTLLCHNQNVMFTNAVWGRRKTPIAPKCEPGHVDPFVVCSGYAHPFVAFDETGRVAVKVEPVPDVPLIVTRTLAFRDDRIAVTVELVATADLDLTELYECVPYFVDKREFRTFNGNLDEGSAFTPPAVLCHEGKGCPAGHFTGENPDLPAVTFRAFDVAAESGAGSTVIFDRDAAFRQTQPTRYRAVAAGVGAFNLPLAANMAAGTRQTVRYVIYSHSRAVTAAELRQVAADEGL